MPSTDNFTVVVKVLLKDKVLEPEEFDYVIVASGHYSISYVPSFPGVGKFPGRVLHVHDHRDAGKTTVVGCSQLLSRGHCSPVHQIWSSPCDLHLEIQTYGIQLA